jgi:hypothetical protein
MMDWNARSAWIYENTAPDLAKAAANKITLIYIDPRSYNAATVIAMCRVTGIDAGIYAVPNWRPEMTGPEFADWVNGLLQDLLPKTAANVEAAPFMADLEGVTTAWMRAFIRRYRQHQPSRPTSITVAPFQGGLIPTDAIQKAGMHLYPQLYYGPMTPADPSAVLLEMARQGMPANMLHPFYDGAAIPSDARDGAIFTLERIS